MEKRVMEDAIKALNEKEYSGYYVLDTNQSFDPNAPLHGKGDVTFKRYCYSTHRYNKLVAGSIFLYRQPRNNSKCNEFYFFGGGFIKEIIEVGNNGECEAIIENPFWFDKPIYQSNPKLDNIVWTSKTKKIGTWQYFWTQYGMNKITREEFLGIIAGEKIYF